MAPAKAKPRGEGKKKGGGGRKEAKFIHTACVNTRLEYLHWAKKCEVIIAGYIRAFTPKCKKFIGNFPTLIRDA